MVSDAALLPPPQIPRTHHRGRLGPEVLDTVVEGTAVGIR